MKNLETIIVDTIKFIHGTVMPVYQEPGHWTDSQIHSLALVFDQLSFSYSRGKIVSGTFNKVAFTYSKDIALIKFEHPVYDILIGFDYSLRTGSFTRNSISLDCRFNSPVEEFQELLNLTEIVDGAACSVKVVRKVPKVFVIRLLKDGASSFAQEHYVIADTKEKALTELVCQNSLNLDHYKLVMVTDLSASLIVQKDRDVDLGLVIDNDFNSSTLDLLLDYKGKQT